jgi:hypothetical protein
MTGVVAMATVAIIALVLWPVSARREISVHRYEYRKTAPARPRRWDPEELHYLHVAVISGRLQFGTRDLPNYRSPHGPANYPTTPFYRWRVANAPSWDTWRWRYSCDNGNWDFAGVSISEGENNDPFKGPLIESFFSVRVPLYMVALTFAGPAYLVFNIGRRRRRRAATGHCVRCGYDLRATNDRCPECGTPVPEPESREALQATGTETASKSQPASVALQSAASLAPKPATP